jgi:hypothetical protein
MTPTCTPSSPGRPGFSGDRRTSPSGPRLRMNSGGERPFRITLRNTLRAMGILAGHLHQRQMTVIAACAERRAAMARGATDS